MPITASRIFSIAPTDAFIAAGLRRRLINSVSFSPQPAENLVQGPEWVWVAEKVIFSAGTPVFSEMRLLRGVTSSSP